MLMGVLAPWSVHTRPSTQSPHRQEQKFSRACVCRVNLKHLPQHLRSHIQSFQILRLFLKKKKPCPPKYVIVRRLGGSPPCFLVGILIFLLVAKFRNPMTTPSRILTMGREEEKRRLKDFQLNFIITER